MPFQRVSAYLKRGQLKLELDPVRPEGMTREWVVLDVVKLAVLRELTELGVAISRASEFVKDLIPEQMQEDSSGQCTFGKPPRAFIVLDVASIARDVRRRLEALETA